MEQGESIIATSEFISQQDYETIAHGVVSWETYFFHCAWSCSQVSSSPIHCFKQRLDRAKVLTCYASRNMLSENLRVVNKAELRPFVSRINLKNNVKMISDVRSIGTTN